MSGPSVVSVINDLTCGRTQEAMDFLRRAPMDNGIACETVDRNTEGVTVASFASIAGCLAFGLRMAHNAVAPETSVVKTKVPTSESLYKPPPETEHDTRKARL